MVNEKKILENIPVVILSGGRGIFLKKNQSLRLNKGLVSIYNKPLFLWVISHYLIYGARDFIIAVGIQFEDFVKELKKYVVNESLNENLFIVNIYGVNCKIRLVQTPVLANTTSRLLACKNYLSECNDFAMTYSDTLSDTDLVMEYKFHKNKNLIATLVSARFPVRFRVLGIRSGEEIVRGFSSRPVIENSSINGGYYFFSNNIWSYLKDDDPLENYTLEKLASIGQLIAFDHNNNWQNLDSEKDLLPLEAIAKLLEKNLA